MGKFLTCLAAIVLFTSCTGMSDKPLSGGAISFLPAPESSKKLIVFVHGILGDPESSWTNQEGVSWPDLIKNDERFLDFTVATYRYDTPFLHRSSNIEEIAERLLLQLEDRSIFEKFNEVYFIAHSMGGLVVKRVLINLNRPHQIQKLRTVKAVLYISTPAQGANLAETGSWLSANPQLRDMQPANLNSFLQTLENQWQNLIRDRGTPPFPQSFCAYETKPNHGVVTVNRIYATTYCDQSPLPVDEDHSNIVKPSNRESTIYDWARARILGASALAQGQKLEYFLKKTPYNYQAGLNVEGVEWKDNYREYEFTVRNPSKTERVVDLRLSFALPWPLIVSRLASQEGCEGLAFTGMDDTTFKIGSQKQITKLQDTWTNLLNIGATTMFPEAEFRGKLIVTTKLPPSAHARLKAEYRDGTSANKKTFYYKISVLDPTTGTVKIEPEPLKGKQETTIQFMPKEPIGFPKSDSKQELKTPEKIGLANDAIHLDCNYGLMPTVMPAEGTIHLLQTFPIPAESGDGGLGRVFSEPGSKHTWGTDDGPWTGYKCQITNYGASTIFNVQTIVGLTFMENMKDKDNPNTSRSGQVTLSRGWLVPVNKIDPGPDRSFVFYIYNSSNHFVDISLPKIASIQKTGTIDRINIPIIGSDSGPIVLPPISIKKK